MIEKVGRASWLDNFCSETILLSLIVDYEVLVQESGVLPNCDQTLNETETSSRTLSYRLHLQRLKLYKQLL